MRDQAASWCHEDAKMAGLLENCNHYTNDEEEVTMKRDEKERKKVECKRPSDAKYTQSGNQTRLDKHENVGNVNITIMKGNEREVDQEVFEISNETKTTAGEDKTRCHKQDEKEENVNLATMKGDQEEYGASSEARNTMDRDKTLCDEGDKKEGNVNFLTAITLEPILFIHNICSQVVWIASQDLMTDKTCSVSTELISYTFVTFTNYDFLRQDLEGVYSQQMII